jgi:transcriptional pleiotropic regulator of transition state genes
MIKATGIVRRVDNVGRFVFPAELRRAFQFVEPDSELDFSIAQDNIVVTMHSCNDASGIVRQTDKMGRAALPNGIRKKLGIMIGDSLEIFTDENKIILRKYEPGCVLCGNLSDLLIHPSGKKICRDCLNHELYRA